MPSPYYSNPYSQARTGPIGGNIMAGGPYRVPYDPYANNPGLQAMEAYRQAKAARRAKEKEDALYSMQIAELQGQYTPELEQKVLAPLQEEPAFQDRMLGSIGRLFGSDTQRGLMGPPPSVPGGLKTQYERGLGKEQEERAYLGSLEEKKHKRAMEADRARQQGALSVKRTEVEEGLVDEPVTRKEREAALKQKGKAGSTGGPKVGQSEELIKAALLSGELTLDQMTKEQKFVVQRLMGLSPEEKVMEATKLAKIYIEQQIKTDAVPRELIKDPVKYKAYVKQVTMDMLDMLEELSGLAAQEKAQGDKEKIIKDIWGD